MKIKTKQAGAELVQAQLKLELGFTSTKIWGLTLMIASYILLLNMVSLCVELTPLKRKGDGQKKIHIQHDNMR